jgi:hypothetical protein
MAFSKVVLDVLVFWTWLATLPATFCWNCIVACLWASLATTYYTMKFSWCILHLAFSLPQHSLAPASGSRPIKRPSLPAAPSLMANNTPTADDPSLPADPVAVQQQHHINDETDVPAATTNNDTNSHTKLKAGAIASHAAPTPSDDRQGLQDTATAAGPPTPTVEVPSTPTAAAPPTPAVAAPPTPTAEASPAPIAVAVPANPTLAGAPPASAPVLGICAKEAAIMATVINFNQEMRKRGLCW